MIDDWMVTAWMIGAGLGLFVDLVIIACSYSESKSYQSMVNATTRRKAARDGLIAAAALPLVILWPIGIFVGIAWGMRDMWKTAELPSLEQKREERRGRKLQEIEDNKALAASRTALLEQEMGIGKS